MSLSVFITGGTSGIGLAMAQAYLDRGATVGICSRSLDKVSDFNHKNLYKYEADVIDKVAMEITILEYFSEHGLDYMVASAGIGYAKKKKIPDFDQSRQIYEVNVVGVLNAFEPAMKIMLKQKSGKLIAISSLAAFNGLPGVSAYSASKAAVKQLCESFAIDLKDQGIGVTCIAPGFIDTPLTRRNHHPMPFLMESDKAAKLILRAIEKNKVLYAFPFILSNVVRLLSFLPRGLYTRIMTRDSMNYSLREK